VHRIEPSDLLEDAEATAELAVALGASWVAADGYHLDAHWQTAFGGVCRLLVFDDYGHGSPFCADIVLNQNPSADAALYRQRHSETDLLLGARYALLRSQFSAWRGWKRATAPKARRLLVTFGGTDPVGMTLRVVDALRTIPDLEAQLVVGGGNVLADRIVEACVGTRFTVHRNVTAMAELIASCDFALCAAGSTTLECAFLQTPQILVSVADNQRALADALASAGVAESLGWHSNVSAQDLIQAVTTLQEDASRRSAMSLAAGEMVDGLGGDRVVCQMLARTLTLRPLGPGDQERLWLWANDPQVRAASFSGAPIPWENHVLWFASLLGNPCARAWIAGSEAGESVGCIRFAIEKKDATLSIVLDPAFRGRGLGAAVIALASRVLFAETDVSQIHAYIRPSNRASVSAFRKSGYLQGNAVTLDGDTAEHFILQRTVNS
jgi:spore coat polysaccharide biosynthesis predicted glycosyltransferase SpsG/RimJ/RimL family protein N-acetyltransferase